MQKGLSFHPPAALLTARVCPGTKTSLPPEIENSGGILDHSGRPEWGHPAVKKIKFCRHPEVS
jgi:hypothetical protein